MPAQPAQPAAGRLESTFERPEDTLHAIQGPPERPWRGHPGPRPKKERKRCERRLDADVVGAAPPVSASWASTLSRSRLPFIE